MPKESLGLMAGVKARQMPGDMTASEGIRLLRGWPWKAGQTRSLRGDEPVVPCANKGEGGFREGGRR